LDGVAAVTTCDERYGNADYLPALSATRDQDDGDASGPDLPARVALDLGKNGLLFVHQTLCA
jgi:hypothetical protein